MDRDTKIRFNASYNILKGIYDNVLEYEGLVAELKSREPDVAALKAETAKALKQIEDILKVDLPDDGGLIDGKY